MAQQLVDRTFSDAEWEAICRRCGKCCYEKEEDEEGRVAYLDIPCVHLTEDSLCRVYPDRLEVESACNCITAGVVREGRMMPPSCAYVKLYGELLDALERSFMNARRRSR